MTPLFGYGTFHDPAWRRAILGVDYPAESARLHGWRRATTAVGYLTVVPAGAGDAPVPGVLIALDDAGWRIADAWEGVPHYARVAVRVETAGGEVDATLYAAAPSDAVTALTEERLASISDGDVEAAIARFIAGGRRAG